MILLPLSALLLWVAGRMQALQGIVKLLNVLLLCRIGDRSDHGGKGIGHLSAQAVKYPFPIAPRGHQTGMPQQSQMP